MFKLIKYSLNFKLMTLIDVFLENPVGQILGLFAMSILLYGLTIRDDKKAMKIIMFSKIFWFLHFLVMGVYSAMLVTAISSIRLALTVKFKRNTKIFIGIIILILISGYITYDTYYSILPIIASLISAYGFLFLDKIKLRLFMYITSLFWLCFNIFSGSIGGVVNEVIAELILLTTMYKMIHEEGKHVFIIDKLFETFKKPKFDVGRFIYIYDFIAMHKHIAKHKISKKLNKLKKIMKFS